MESRRRCTKPEIDDRDGDILVEYRPLLPEGLYVARLESYETRKYRGESKLVLQFRIVEPTAYEGAEVHRFFRLDRLKGTPKRFGGGVAPSSGDLVTEYQRLTDSEARRDRISFRPLLGSLIKIRVRTSVMDWRGRDRAASTTYSVVAELIGVVESSGPDGGNVRWLLGYDSAMPKG